MNNPIREHLIGYLVGAIEPEERSLVEQHLEHDESLRRELEVLRQSLHPLAADQTHHQSPAGLAQRCCEYVFSRAEVMPVALSPAGSGAKVTRRWSWLELTVAGAIAASVAVFLLPKIYQSQIQSQLLACQNNLKDIGFAASNYGQRNGGYYPVVQPGDRINAAGVWAPTLVSENYLPQSGRTVVCPSSALANDAQFHVPTLEEVAAMNAAQLAQIMPRLGGSYAMTLGYRNQGEGPYKLQRNQGREHFAVVSDMPGKNGTNSPNHGGRGQNVLWDDGHVSFMSSPQSGPDADNIFSNTRQEVAPGLNSDDAVIVPSQLQLP
jgi:hypothetical protein